MRLLAAVPDLQKLTLWGPGITDAGLEQLAPLTHLTNLSLDNTAVTDAGLAKLAPLTSLKTVVLQRSTEVTNEGLVPLAKLPNLTYLTLLYTRVTMMALPISRTPRGFGCSICVAARLATRVWPT